MPPTQRRHLQYLRSLDAQVSLVEQIRDDLQDGTKLSLEQHRVLLFMLAHLEAQISCLVRAERMIGEE